MNTHEWLPLDAGGRYRLRRWDEKSQEWVAGVSQPWDVRDNAEFEAQKKANRDNVKYMVVDRLGIPVHIAHPQNATKGD